LNCSSNPGAAVERHDVIGSVLSVSDPRPVIAERDDPMVRMKVVAGADEFAGRKRRRELTPQVGW
jgi:hypothetical protein